MVYIVLVVALIGCGLAGACFLLIRQLGQRFDTALGGIHADSLEQRVNDYFQQIEAVGQRLQELNQEYERLTISNSLASQKIAIIRFNPFGDTGGDQSFSLAVLDAHNSGYVLTSIHGRQGTRVYVKPIDYGQSKYSLSQEEQQALELATKRVPQL